VDLGVLTGLANQFFAALPGSTLPADSPRPRFPASGGAGEFGTPTPALAPTSADFPSSLLDVPRAPAAVPPVLASTPNLHVDPRTAPVSAPSTPYYFLGEANAQRLSPQADPGELPSFGLPGEAELQQLLTVLPAVIAARPEVPQDPARQDPDRYFLRAEPGSQPATRHPPFDVGAVRRDFPILSERVNGRPLVWLDNAATTQKPRAVIDQLSYFYEHENSNIHRAAHELAARVTDAYEGARGKVARFLNAGSVNEIIFVRGATEAINLVAQTWGKQNIGDGDEIVISHLEHHANIVPWQRLAAETGAKLKVIPVDDDGQLRLDEYQKLLNHRTKLVAVTHVSNALGTITPIQQVVDLGHRAGACVLVDGAQSVSHLRIDLQRLDADFFVFSGHKIFGPTGIGVVSLRTVFHPSIRPYGITSRLTSVFASGTAPRWFPMYSSSFGRPPGRSARRRRSCARPAARCRYGLSITRSLAARRNGPRSSAYQCRTECGPIFVDRCETQSSMSEGRICPISHLLQCGSTCLAARWASVSADPPRRRPAFVVRREGRLAFLSGHVGAALQRHLDLGLAFQCGRSRSPFCSHKP
jgi:cysteine desulfurase / selenocysteine lyase